MSQSGMTDHIRDMERLSKHNLELADQARAMRDFLTKLRGDSMLSEKLGGDIDEYMSSVGLPLVDNGCQLTIAS